MPPPPSARPIAPAIADAIADAASPRKKRKMRTTTDETDALAGGVEAVLVLDAAARESARRRWQLLRKHVCITQWYAPRCRAWYTR